MLSKTTLTVLVLSLVLMLTSIHQLNAENEHDFDDDHDMSDFDETDEALDAVPEQFGAKEIPSLKMKGIAQTLKFKFCYSCGYRNMFDQYSALVSQRYPDIKIVGENYTPVAWKMHLAQFLGTAKILVIGFIVFGQSPFEYIGAATPQIFTWATENKLYACMMTFFLSNAIETQLITTGAFEIYLNDVQIWSKIESDRMPHEKELLQMLDMNFNFDSEKATGFAPEHNGNFRI